MKTCRTKLVLKIHDFCVQISQKIVNPCRSGNMDWLTSLLLYKSLYPLSLSCVRWNNPSLGCVKIRLQPPLSDGKPYQTARVHEVTTIIIIQFGSLPSLKCLPTAKSLWHSNTYMKPNGYKTKLNAYYECKYFPA